MSMEDSGSHSLGFRLDIKQILLEAQHRWLRPAEICEILRNYRKFHISPEPPHKPVSGSVFLFDRKALRYFRKDGHNWRKKKDGKTVKEAHEKLKVGSVDMLHCYYAHGEDDENFQRRSYWMLEEDLMHIVFVHYLAVKGNKTYTSYNRNAETAIPGSKGDSSLSFSFPDNSNHLASPSTDSTSPTSTLTSAYEDAESEVSQQASSGFQSEDSWVTGQTDANPQRCYHMPPYSGDHTTPGMGYASVPYPNADGTHAESSFTHGTQKTLDMASWEEVFGHGTAGEIADKQGSGTLLPIQANWQHSLGDSSLQMPRAPANDNVISSLAYNSGKSFFEEKSFSENLQSIVDSFDMCPEVQEEQALRSLQKQNSHTELGFMLNQKSDNSMKSIGTGNYSRILKQSLVGGAQVEEGLKKVDSFSKWIAKELGEVDELAIQSTCGISWSVIDNGNVVDGNCIPNQLQLDSITLNPSLSKDQLFSIMDFSPNWAYSNCETEVLITGTFLKSKQEAANCRWSCMFGEVEVPVEVLVDGILRCYAPRHRAGLVPFYITCSNRLACSEVREFEYRVGPKQEIGYTKTYDSSTIDMHLRNRLERLLSLQPVRSIFSFENVGEGKEVVNNIITLMEENCRVAMLKPELGFMLPKVMDEQLHENGLKEMFYPWLLHKVTEDGKGPGVLDEEGQGMLHLGAALGFNWVFQPIIASGVSIDFRDVNGWTALHWAAFYGREETVAALVSLGAAPGALTDPSAEFPLGRTPADLASANGHKGISGFLAESSLTTHLLSLTVNDTKGDELLAASAEKGIQTVSERGPILTTEDDAPDALSLKDSLAAVCNATQAAARIHQIFRIQSFQRKQFVEQGSDDLLSQDEQALSLLAAKRSRLGQENGTIHTAATCIQKKYRGWKKRQEFLLIRQRIVKIQAHVRGHQVRKKYKPITWSVGILEKVILRWRRKGRGLRGFQQDTVAKDSTTPEMPTVEDDYDILKEGRKQTEERLQKALARVKSMAQNPEARAQYRRLLTVAEDFREPKEASDMIIQGSEDLSYYPEEDLFDVQSLFEDDTLMSMTFQ